MKKTHKIGKIRPIHVFLFQSFAEVALWLRIEFVKVAQIAQVQLKDIQVVTCKSALVLQTSDWNSAQGKVYISGH